MKKKLDIPELSIKEEEKKKNVWTSVGEFFAKGIFAGRWEFKFTWRF